MAADILARTFKALADPTRIEMLRRISEVGEASCQDLQKKFDLSQPTLSHHFKKLIDADIILQRKEKTANFYAVNNVFLKKIGIDINQLLTV